MESESYTTRTGRTLYRPVLTTDELLELDSLGFCVQCGEEAYGVEPDARHYTCEVCGERAVYGLEELVLLQVVRLTDEEER